MAGRLIFPFLGDFALQDIAATAADPDAGGALTSGYDDDFREIVKVEGSGGPNEPGVTARQETIVRIPFQEDDIRNWKHLRMRPSGNSPNGEMGVIFHFDDLYALGLVNGTTGAPTIKIDDRLVAVYGMDNVLRQTVRTPPGLYVADVEPNFGLRSERNLLFVKLVPKDVSR